MFPEFQLGIHGTPGSARGVLLAVRPNDSANRLGLENARSSQQRLMQVVEENIALAEKSAAAKDAKDKRKKGSRLRKAKDVNPEFEDMDVD